MELRFILSDENYAVLSKKFEVLANKRHLRILNILEKGGKSNDQVYEILKKDGVYLHRTNTYRALEKLVKQKIINKTYNGEKKKFFYTIS